MGFLMTLITHLPVADLLARGVETNSSLGFVYDVAQAAIALKLLATGAAKLAEATPWTWDDGPTKATLAWVTKATAWVTGLTSTPRKNATRG